MRASEIADVLGKPTRYISSYLSYWRTRGLFEYRDGYWMLTEEGVEFAKRVLERYTSSGNPLEALAKQIALQAKVGKKTYHQPGQYPQPLLLLATQTSQLDDELLKRQKCVEAISKPIVANLEDEERDVMEAILSHYTQWGKTYMYLDQLQKQLDADLRWLMTILRELQAKNLVYIYHDRRLGIRVGLSKHLREKIDNCLSGNTVTTPP